MTPNPHAQRRGLYTAKTVTTSASAIAAQRQQLEAEEWGTMDPSPGRVAGPSANSMFDWGIVIALVGLFGGFTLLGGGTILAALAVVFLNADPSAAAANVGDVTLAQVAPTPDGPATVEVVALTSEKAAPPAREAKKKSSAKSKPRKRTRARKAPAASAPRAIPTQTAGEQAMSLSQLKQHLSNEAAPAPAAAAPARPAPAPAAPVADDDDFLNDLIAEPTPAPAAPAPAPVRAPVAPAPARRAPAPAPPQGTAGGTPLSTRLSKMPNGVLILDEPFDPVPVAVATDGDAAIYVDGELLGGAPLAVVVDRGGHEVTVQSEKGTVSFDLDASEGDKWCFSVKRGPKLASCR